MKTCSRCKQTKPLEDFCRDAKAKDGKHYYCRPCNRSAVRGHHKAYPDKRTDRSRRYDRRNPEKHRAHIILNTAITAGKVVRPGACSACAVSCKPEAHHDDYTQPLVVRWLCKTCHVQHHEQERARTGRSYVAREV